MSTTILGPADTVRCPIDDIEFRPYYTDGACPICGWRPPGAVVARPWWLRLDPGWTAFLSLVAAGVLMAILVIVVYATS